MTTLSDRPAANLPGNRAVHPGRVTPRRDTSRQGSPQGYTPTRQIPTKHPAQGCTPARGPGKATPLQGTSVPLAARFVGAQTANFRPRTRRSAEVSAPRVGPLRLLAGLERHIERLDLVGQRADRYEIHAALGIGAQRIERDAAAGFGLAASGHLPDRLAR